MCDCYVTECAGPNCTSKLSIHIADYCVERDEVEAYCPHCTKKLAKQHKKHRKTWPAFIDRMKVYETGARYDRRERLWVYGSVPNALILCVDHDSYGISFN